MLNPPSSVPPSITPGVDELEESELRLKAYEGDCYAYFLLHRKHYYARERPEACAQYQLAVNEKGASLEYALIGLGNCQSDGYEVSLVSGLPYWTHDRLTNHPVALYLRGSALYRQRRSYYQADTLTPLLLNTVIDLLRTACHLGIEDERMRYPPALQELGDLMERSNRFRDAFALFEQARQLGHEPAAYGVNRMRRRHPRACVPWGRWMPMLHRHFPPVVRRAVTEFLLVSKRKGIHKDVVRIIVGYICTSLPASPAQKENTTNEK